MGNSGMIAGAFSSTSGLADTVLTTDGDILYYNSGRQRLAKGDNDDVLTLKSGLPSWETPAGGVTLSAQTATLGSTFSTSANATWTTVTGLSFTALNNTGRSLVVTALPVYNSTVGLWIAGKILDGSTDSAGMGFSNPLSNYGVMMSTAMSIENDGQTVAVQIYKADTSSLSVLGASVTAGEGMFTVTQIS